MTNPFAPMDHMIDSAGVVSNDLNCRKCGYNLRGLNSDGRCPECGAAVGLSVQGNFLRFSDPQWVRTLRRGITLIILGIVAIVLIVIVTIPLGLAGSPRLSLGLISVGVLVMYALMLVGSWLLTEPDPSGVGEDQYGVERKLIRIGLAVGAGNTLLEMGTEALDPAPSVRMVMDLIGFAAALFAIVATYVQAQYLEKLALRIPDIALSRRAYFLKYAMTIPYALIILLGLIMQVRGGGALAAGGGCAMGILGLAALIFGIMYLLLLEKLGKRFAEQAAIAEQTWARLDTPAPASDAGA